MQFYTLSQQSLTKTGGSSVVEEYIPLWMADGTTVWSNGNTKNFLEDGSSSTTTSPSASGLGSLYTLNSNWNSSQKFAFEASIRSEGVYTAYAAIRDLTTSTDITASQISTTSTTLTVLRSSTFSLTPGHVYGVCIWISITSGTVDLSEASLVVFGQ